jgi:hypothetical protein
MLELTGFSYNEMVRSARQIHSIITAYSSVPSVDQLMEEVDINDRVVGLIRASLQLSDHVVLNKHKQICLM